MKKSSLLLIVSTLFLSNCLKEGVNSEPKADFSFKIISKAPDGIVEFISTSANAKTFLWDFGDGETSDEKDPVHFYEKTGIYSVKLIAKNGSKLNSITKSVDMSVGNYSSVFIKSLSILKIPNQDANGNNWDPSDAPDLYVMIQPLGESFILNTYTGRFANASKLPVGWDFQPSVQIKEFYKIYVLYVYDDDPPNYVTLISRFECRFWDLDPFPTTIDLENGESILRLELAWF